MLTYNQQHRECDMAIDVEFMQYILVSYLRYYIDDMYSAINPIDVSYISYRC